MGNTPQGEAAPITAEMEIGADMMGQAVQHLGLKTPAGLIVDDAAEIEETETTEDTEAEAEQSTEATETTTTEDTTDDSEADDTTEEQDSTEETEADEDTTTEADPEAAATAADLKKLPAELRKTVQGILDKRIGKITAKAKGEVEAATARATELETQLAEAKQGKNQPVIVPAGVNPLFLANSEAEIDQRLEQIETFEDWAETHAEGVNLPESDDHDPKQPSYTPEQIRARLREVRKERDKVIPAARENVKKRAEFDVALRKVAPSLYDSKHEDYVGLQTIAQRLPELKRFPDWKVLAYQQLLGRKALAEMLKQKEAPKKPAATTAPKKIAPRVPGAGGAAKGGVAERKTGRTDTSDAVKQFSKAPTRENLLKVAAGFVD